MQPGEAEAVPFANPSQHIKDATIEVRLGFIRKVYALLSTQLLLTVAVAAPLQTVSKSWLVQNQWLLFLSVGMMVATLCAMTCCCRNWMKTFPQNYILLFTFTAFEGVCVGFISAQYTWQSVVLAAGITVVVFLGLTVYATMTTTDFTGFGAYLYGALITLITFGFVISILSLFTQVQWLIMLYDLAGVLLFVFYIIFDTQLILGEYGGHKIQFSIDDYCFAALNLYLDIINLFLHILALLGERRR